MHDVAVDVDVDGGVRAVNTNRALPGWLHGPVLQEPYALRQRWVVRRLAMAGASSSAAKTRPVTT